jgi:hypothetical protein
VSQRDFVQIGWWRSVSNSLLKVAIWPISFHLLGHQEDLIGIEIDAHSLPPSRASMAQVVFIVSRQKKLFPVKR